MKIKKENIGSSLDDFLKEEGIYEQVTAAAIKRSTRDQTSKQSEQSTFGKLK